MAYGFGAFMAYFSENPAWFALMIELKTIKSAMFSIFIKGQDIMCQLLKHVRFLAFACE